ncbi:monooxygenase [Arthrobacter sp. AQ5-06]|nr:monooxygenase [Arthrobacter sp. AQ5-06]
MESSAEKLSCDVVVVGAGPSGMSAAALLAARGLSVVVLERRMGTSNEPKAISLDDESLRIYQQAGIAEDVLAIIVPGTGTRYYDSNNEPLFQAKAAVPYRLGYPFKNPFAQPDLERVLAAGLVRNERVSLRFGFEVIAVDQDADSARVTAVGAGGPLTVDARFVLGADGGRSAVRELLGIAMTGRSYRDVWLVVDTLEDPHTERYGMHHGDPIRPHVIVPGLSGRCRYEFLLFPGEGEAGGAPDFGLIQRLVAPYRRITAEQVERAVNYRFNAVNADRWRAGRVFLLGDAAHMMPPFAGQGLNSGIRDAGNLAWKIAEVVNGKAPDAVLDSYESERKPHAQATIGLSVRLGSVVMTTSARAAAHRDAAARCALDTPDGRAFFEEMRYRPLARYRTGLVINNPATEDPAISGALELVGTAPGQPLVFDTASRRPRRLDDVLGTDWAILGVDVEPGGWNLVRRLSELTEAARWQVTLSDSLPRPVDNAGVLLDLDGGLYREFEPFRGCFVLLRPDRFIAAVWRPEDTPTIISAVTSWRTRISNPADLRPAPEPQLIR